MRRRDFVVVLVVVAAFGLLSQLRALRGRPLPPPPLPALPVAAAPEAPAFSLPDLSGRTRALADEAGKVVLLNFWATWCPPCREELPALQQLHETLAGEGFAVLAVSVDAGSSESVARFTGRHGVGFPVLHDPGSEVAALYRVRAYPTSLVVDRRGRVVARLASAYDWADPEAVGWLRTLLGGAPEGDRAHASGEGGS